MNEISKKYEKTASIELKDFQVIKILNQNVHKKTITFLGIHFNLLKEKIFIRKLQKSGFHWYSCHTKTKFSQRA